MPLFYTFCLHDRMVHAIFWLPTALKRNQENVRRKLEAYEAKFKEYECSQEEDNKDEKEPDRIQASTTVTGETASTSSASITAAEPKKEL